MPRSIRDSGSSAPAGRVFAAHRRARLAKGGLVAIGLVVFGSGIAATRATVAGHSRRALRPLTPPALFVRIVRQDALRAGVIMPTQAPPSASTAQS